MPKPTTLPTWDTTEVNITAPVGEQSVGWGTSQAPSAQVFNWLHFWTYRWAEYINNALGMAADAWAWTGRHSFIRPHATESAVEISNSGGGQALVVTGPSTTGSIDSTTVDADSVSTRSLSAISASGTAATITNSDPASTAASLVVTHAGGLQRALDVLGDEVVDGYLSATKSIACTAGNISSSGNISTTSGTISGATVAATGQCGGNTVVATTVVTGKVGAFSGITTFGSERGFLNVPCVESGQRPTSGITGEFYLVNDGSSTRLYHCDEGPDHWSYIIFTRAY